MLPVDPRHPRDLGCHTSKLPLWRHVEGDQFTSLHIWMTSMMLHCVRRSERETKHRWWGWNFITSFELPWEIARGSLKYDWFPTSSSTTQNIVPLHRLITCTVQVAAVAQYHSEPSGPDPAKGKTPSASISIMPFAPATVGGRHPHVSMVEPTCVSQKSVLGKTEWRQKSVAWICCAYVLESLNVQLLKQVHEMHVNALQQTHTLEILCQEHFAVQVAASCHPTTITATRLSSVLRLACWMRQVSLQEANAQRFKLAVAKMCKVKTCYHAQTSKRIQTFNAYALMLSIVSVTLLMEMQVQWKKTITVTTMTLNVILVIYDRCDTTLILPGNYLQGIGCQEPTPK